MLVQATHLDAVKLLCNDHRRDPKYYMAVVDDVAVVVD